MGFLIGIFIPKAATKCYINNAESATNDKLCDATKIYDKFEGALNGTTFPTTSSIGFTEYSNFFYYGNRAPYNYPRQPGNTGNNAYPATIWISGLSSGQFSLLSTSWFMLTDVGRNDITTPVLHHGAVNSDGIPIPCDDMQCIVKAVADNQDARKVGDKWLYENYEYDADEELWQNMTTLFPVLAVHFSSFDPARGIMNATIASFLPDKPENEGPQWNYPVDTSEVLKSLPPWAYTYFIQPSSSNNGPITPGTSNLQNNYNVWYPSGQGFQNLQGNAWTASNQHHTAPTFTTLMANLLNTAMWRAHSPNLATSNVDVFFSSMPDTFDVPSASTNPGVIVMVTLLPIGTQLLLPLFVSEIASDISSKSLVLVKIMGLKTWQYWTALYCFFMVLELLLGIIYSALILAMGIMAGAVGPILFLTFVAYGHCMVGLAMSIAGLVSRPRIGVIISFVWTVIGGPSCAVLVWVMVTNSTTGAMPPEIMFIPPMALSYCFLQMAQGATSGAALYAPLYLVGTGTILMILGTFCYGIRTGLLREWFSCSCLKRSSSSSLNPQAVPLKDARGQRIDEDVTMMTKDVNALCDANKQGAKALVLQSLVKAFPKGGRTGGTSAAGQKRIQDNQFLAVKGVSWYADHGECFGLLGPNGAGKTTTMHMIEGSLPPTAGKMFVNGVDNNVDPEQVHRMLGVCQQENILWDDLSVKDHLFLYACIKGVVSADRVAHVQHVAEVVQLDGDEFNQVSTELSGGMKRRLCIGIALVGNPTVLLLDEPTTGLDPESRRVVWDVIHSCRQSRCVVLTTHSMEEADALCSRIAIMANGQLQCVGGQIHLKNKFGSGYKLTVTVHASTTAANAMEFCTEVLSRTIPRGLKIVSAVGTTTTYSITGADIDVAAIFQAMETQEMRQTVADWGFAMCSLDDVFISVVDSAENNSNHGAFEQAAVNTPTADTSSSYAYQTKC